MYDKTQFYKDQISPKLKEIFDLCVAEGIPFLGVAVVKENEKNAHLITTQVVKSLAELPVTFAVLLEVMNNAEYLTVCSEILELALLRKALSRKLASAERNGTPLQ